MERGQTSVCPRDRVHRSYKSTLHHTRLVRIRVYRALPRSCKKGSDLAHKPVLPHPFPSLLAPPKDTRKKQAHSPSPSQRSRLFPKSIRETGVGVRADVGEPGADVVEGPARGDVADEEAACARVRASA
ncbi:hypothetical protein B0H19DRAFT_376656 [Mycena capillaripes]|nr:hypothetical protein B0H19DRAFT_376656 [Mycena capillaripes]